MADDKEKTSEDATEEEQHEPDSNTESEPDEDDETECDEAIGELLATIAALESRVGELEHKLEQHGIEYEHAARVEPGATDGSEPTPEERHFYFRRIGK